MHFPANANPKTKIFRLTYAAGANWGKFHCCFVCKTIDQLFFKTLQSYSNEALFNALFVTMQGEAACLLGPYPAHIGVEVGRDDTLSNSSPGKIRKQSLL